jgi:hypothetical protein
MTPLEEAIAGARAADRAARIEWRDRIAAHGVAAIEAIEPWVADPELGAFAVRVIGAVGASGESDAAIGSLVSVTRVAPSLAVRSDIGRELARLRPPATRRSTKQSFAVPDRAGWDWPGFRAEDFGQVKGTTWRRSRDPVGLVPLLLRPLQQLDSAFASFPIYMNPEVHLADRDRYTQGGLDGQGWRASKLVVYAPGPTLERPDTPARVVAGFYIEKGTGADKFGPVERSLWDWPVFVDLLYDPSRRRLLEEAVESHGLLLGDYFGQRFTPDGAVVGFVGRSESGTLVLRNHSGKVIDEGWEALVGRIEALPAGEWHDFHVWREWPAQEAIDAGQPFATRQILPVLNDLARVYLDLIGLPGYRNG